MTKVTLQLRSGSVRTFGSAREAKEYLISEIVLVAEREGIPLSQTERKMMYFTETSEVPADIGEVKEVSEKDFDTASYEAKIARIAATARTRAAAAGDLEIWAEAVQVLGREDHYLLVLLDSPRGLSAPLLRDRLKLIATAFLIVLCITVGIILFTSL